MQENDHSDDDDDDDDDDDNNDDDDDKFDSSGILYMCSLNRVSTLHNHQHHLIYFIVPTPSHLFHRTNIISTLSSCDLHHLPASTHYLYIQSLTYLLCFC